MSFQEVVYIYRAIKWFKAAVGTVRGLHECGKMISFKTMAVAAVLLLDRGPCFSASLVSSHPTRVEFFPVCQSATIISSLK